MPSHPLKVALCERVNEYIFEHIHEHVPKHARKQVCAHGIIKMGIKRINVYIFELA